MIDCLATLMLFGFFMGVLIFLMMVESERNEPEHKSQTNNASTHWDRATWEPVKQDWDLCPISLEKIQDPLFCLVDGRLYEKSTVQKMFRFNITRSPVNRKPIQLNDFVRLVNIPSYVQK